MNARAFRTMGCVTALWAAVMAGGGPGAAQGFAGLGMDAEGFAIPQPDRTLSFPADHGPHPAYRIEWWYVTAVLSGTDGRDYGVQWTLFRTALRPEDGEGWETPQLWMGHAGLTTPETHVHAERRARGGIGQAGATADPFRAHIDDWAMTSTAGPGTDALSALDLTSRGRDFSYDLSLAAAGPLVFHGADGYSVKSPLGQASYYYSQPFYDVSGHITLPDGRTVEVTGKAWLDREWSSQPLSADQTGWDWFSLHFDGGEKMMGFGLRARDGSVFTAATWISADGVATAYPDGALRLSPLEHASVAGRRIPVTWRLELPARGLSVEARALNPQSWMDTSFPYWEGPVRVEGSHSGRGYLEMTGHD